MKVRKCAWMPMEPDLQRKPSRPVWARKGVVSMACPKSVITAPTLNHLERFSYWKAGGGGSLMQERAKDAEAILYLNEQWREEQKNGEVKEL